MRSRKEHTIIFLVLYIKKSQQIIYTIQITNSVTKYYIFKPRPFAMKMEKRRKSGCVATSPK